MAWSRRSSALAFLRARVVLLAAGADVGNLPRLRGRVRVTNRGTLVVGDRLLLDSPGYRTQLFVGPSGRLQIGDEVYVNQGADISVTQEVTIGDRVLFGPHVTVVDDTAHAVAPDAPRKIAPVVVESDAWLGRRSLIMPGVTVGRYSVVGAGAVVTRDVPPCSVVAGSPARIVRQFDLPPESFRR